MAKKPFTEYLTRELFEPLSQGDVFYWKTTDTDPWKQLGIVITADCDLAHGKFGGSLSYCPILKFKDFLQLFWLSKDLANLVQKQAEKSALSITKSRRINRPEYTEPIQNQSLIKWLERRGIEGILDDIQEPIGKSRAILQNDLELLNELIEATNSRDIVLQITTIAKARAPKPPMTPEETNKSMNAAWKLYLGKLKQLPGDLFFLNELSPTHKEGYIVYLRRIAEMNPNDIATNVIEQRVSKAVRVSQLRGAFKYRITQKLAAVFSDIGLPTDYEEMCLSTMNSIAAQLNITSN
ncbi:hypothetical protein [Hymenobacter lapidiphilus]|uniref:Uncharacterized protein n=1 Tax=Hymenobacter lapidiphilus TaxID=2608003 RepID=A0A7Y7U3Y6_9BACT|nr:hypothetical protein [Hymenobacter lapidiphilus]NVO29712.1 hypothetical protein [Hymenobacter lapidiphilus]